MDPIARRKILESLAEGRLTIDEADYQLEALGRSEQRPPLQVVMGWQDLWQRLNWQKKIIWGLAGIFLIPLALVILLVPATLMMGLIVGIVALGLALPALLVLLIWNGLAQVIPIPEIEFWQALLLAFLFALTMRLLRR